MTYHTPTDAQQAFLATERFAIATSMADDLGRTDICLPLLKNPDVRVHIYRSQGSTFAQVRTVDGLTSYPRGIREPSDVMHVLKQAEEA